LLIKRNSTILLAVFILFSSLMIHQTTVRASINGWQQSGTTWNYYINDSKATGWVSSGGSWYYLNSSGDMVTGWVNYGGSWYYLNSNGGMESNKWITLGGKQYFLYSNGTLAVNTTTPDGYVVGSDGAWNNQGLAEQQAISQFTYQMAAQLVAKYCKIENLILLYTGTDVHTYQSGDLRITIYDTPKLNEKDHRYCYYVRLSSKELMDAGGTGTLEWFYIYQDGSRSYGD